MSSPTFIPATVETVRRLRGPTFQSDSRSRCPSCGEYEAIYVHHGHEDGDDDACEQNGMCHSYCTNCDYGICELC